MDDTRIPLLNQWLASLPPELALRAREMVPASSDASFRRYFRLPAGKTTVRVEEPEEEEEEDLEEMRSRLEALRS